MDVLKANTYKSALKSALLYKKQKLSSKLTFQRLAGHIRVQPSYLSRALNGDANLSCDQVFAACEFLGCQSIEKRYVLLLHQRDRATHQIYREHIETEIQNLLASSEETGSHLKATELTTPPSDYQEYFLDPNLQLVHMFLTCPRFQDDPLSIAPQIGVPEERLLEIVQKLESLGFIRHDQGRYQITRDNLHLPAASVLRRPQQTLLRLRGTERAQADSTGQYNFSVLFSTDPTCQQQVRQLFLDFIKDVEELVSSSPQTPERVMQMNFDLIRWDRE